MLINKIFKTVVFCSFFIISFAHASCGYLFNPDTTYGYIAVRGGLAWHQSIEVKSIDDEITRNNYKVGGSGSISMGIGINALRLEAEGLIIYNHIDTTDITLPPPDTIIVTDDTVTGHIRHIAVMFNIFYDFCLNRCATLYLGVGAGVDFYDHFRFSSLSESTSKKNDNLFAFQFMPGLAYHLTPRLDLTLGYRLYMTQRETRDPGPVKTNKIPMVHNLELGLRYKL